MKHFFKYSSLISIIIPCRRVIVADGSVSGYAAVLPVKQKLLEIESVIF